MENQLFHVVDDMAEQLAELLDAIKDENVDFVQYVDGIRLTTQSAQTRYIIHACWNWAGYVYECENKALGSVYDYTGAVVGDIVEQIIKPILKESQ